MKRVIFISVWVISVMCLFTSCISTAFAYEYENEKNVVVVGDTCYVYERNPSTIFLNTLHIVDGAYFYWHSGHYIPVVFPYWEVWSPHRYFYYDNHRWMWRDRYSYNHYEYRRRQHWVDHRVRPYNYHQRIRPNRYNYNRSNYNRGSYNRYNSVRPTQRNNYNRNYRPSMQRSSSRPPINHGGGYNRGMNRPQVRVGRR